MGGRGVGTAALLTPLYLPSGQCPGLPHEGPCTGQLKQGTLTLSPCGGCEPEIKVSAGSL